MRPAPPSVVMRVGVGVAGYQWAFTASSRR